MIEKTSKEDEYRSSLEDVVSLLKKLSPLSDSVADLLGIMALALENEAQFRILMKLVAEKK